MSHVMKTPVSGVWVDHHGCGDRSEGEFLPRTVTVDVSEVGFQSFHRGADMGLGSRLTMDGGNKLSCDEVPSFRILTVSSGKSQESELTHEVTLTWGFLSNLGILDLWSFAWEFWCAQ